MVKELREMTDAGMMECKKALVEADGDMDKAVDVLRTRGLAAAAKKAGRATNEGTVMTVVAEDAKSAAVVELNCETDFVGMNEKFKAYAEKLGRAALAANAADVEALKAASYEGESVEDILTDAIHVLGENIQLPRATTVAAGGVATPADAALMMQLGAEGVFVGSGIFKSGNPEKRAQAIVKAVANYTDAKLIAELSEDLGEAMVGINESEIALLMAERGK